MPVHRLDLRLRTACVRDSDGTLVGWRAALLFERNVSQIVASHDFVATWQVIIIRIRYFNDEMVVARR